MSNITERDLEIARLAGFLDADGTVSVEKVFDRRHGVYRYAVRLLVHQRRDRIGILESFKRTFGGYILFPKDRPDMAIWKLSGAEAGKAVQLMAPYLEVKMAVSWIAECLHLILKFARERAHESRCRTQYTDIEYKACGGLHKAAVFYNTNRPAGVAPSPLREALARARKN